MELPEVNRMPNLTRFFSQFKPIHFKKGDIIQRPDMPSLGVLFLEDGFIKKYTITEGGEEKIVLFCKNHSIFPLSKLFMNSYKDMYIEAITDVSLRSANENDFKEFLKSNPKAMMEFTEYLLEYVDISYTRIKNLGYINSKPRILFCILNLARRFGKIRDNEIVFEIPITHKDIANATAMTRETVGRELEKLYKENCIGNNNQIFTIKDVARLIRKMNNYEELEWKFQQG